MISLISLLRVLFTKEGSLKRSYDKIKTYFSSYQELFDPLFASHIIIVMLKTNTIIPRKMPLLQIIMGLLFPKIVGTFSFSTEIFLCRTCVGLVYLINVGKPFALTIHIQRFIIMFIQSVLLPRPCQTFMQHVYYIHLHGTHNAKEKRNMNILSFFFW